MILKKKEKKKNEFFYLTEIILISFNVNSTGNAYSSILPAFLIIQKRFSVINHLKFSQIIGIKQKVKLYINFPTEFLLCLAAEKLEYKISNKTEEGEGVLFFCHQTFT